MGTQAGVSSGKTPSAEYLKEWCAGRHEHLAIAQGYFQSRTDALHRESMGLRSAASAAPREPPAPIAERGASFLVEGRAARMQAPRSARRKL